jgi:succinylglutamate desuccinylase
MARTVKKAKTLKKESSVKKEGSVSKAMVQKLAATKAKKWDDVHHEQKFFVNDGNTLSNLLELHSALRKMDSQTFAHHVNEEKHDFANWVHDVMGAKTLSKQMRTSVTKTALIRTIKAKI